MSEKMFNKVLDYFQTISKIPRKSGDEKNISNFIFNFAKKRGLECFQDENYNLIIKKNASCNCKNNTPLVLQGHMDMVYVTEEGYEGSYSDGIKIFRKGDMIFAEGTSLGADNGIALAYMLMLMDTDEIMHPDLEFIITVEEEVGLAGAKTIDLSELRGKHLINLDSEEEGVFYTSCAGGIRNIVKIKLSFESKKIDKLVSIHIKGLKGGHSGINIGDGKGNAIKIMGRLLYSLNESQAFNIVDIKCLGKANAIPNSCWVKIAFENYTDDIEKKIKHMENTFARELVNVDSIEIDYKVDNNIGYMDVIDKNTSKKIINFINLVPEGVKKYDNNIPNLIETSSNVGAVTCDGKTVEILSSIRSSVASQKYNIVNAINIIADVLDIEAVFFNDYPQWEYKQKSILRNVAMDKYKKIFGREAEISAIHAGLECGYFDEKLNDIDMISFGPNLYDVHTSNEHISINSISNTLKLLISIIEEFCSINVDGEVIG